MPRDIARKPRFLYPQIATSLSLAKISALAELLFWRILPQADDQGRLSGNPVHIKAIACPIRDEFTIENIPELIKGLQGAELIICYSASSEPVIQIAKWWQYQSSMRRIFPSHYPPPKGWKDTIKGVSVQSDGQPPTIADKVRLEEEVEVEREKEVETEREKEVEVLRRQTPTTPVAATATEAELLSFLETLEGWKFEESADLAWLKEFIADFHDFSLAMAKACRDYHSGRAPGRHKGVWKSRLRHWMEHEKPDKTRLPPGKILPHKEVKEGWERLKGPR